MPYLVLCCRKFFGVALYATKNISHGDSFVLAGVVHMSCHEEAEEDHIDSMKVVCISCRLSVAKPHVFEAIVDYTP